MRLRERKKVNRLQMEFWADRPEVLWLRSYELIPTSTMTKSEQLNALTRFSIAFGISLALYYQTPRYMYIILLVAAIVYAIDRHNKSSTSEKFGQTQCRKPTPNNPFMNPLVGEPPLGPPCDQRNPEINQEVEKHFSRGLYQDVDAVWDRVNSQRQFYTIPGGTTPPDRKAFLDWCYNSKYICKGNPEACLKNLPPRTIMR